MTINLKGYIVANGATDWAYDVFPSFPELIKYFNLIPERIYDNYTEHGCTYFFNDTWKWDEDRYNQSDCEYIWDQMWNLTIGTKKMNWYDFYRKKGVIGS